MSTTPIPNPHRHSDALLHFTYDGVLTVCGKSIHPDDTVAAGTPWVKAPREISCPNCELIGSAYHFHRFN